MFGHIVPKVSLLQRGIANTPTKIDPGYNGALLITTFNHGSRAVKLKVGQPFCSMFIMRVEGDVKPYARNGKDLEGEPRPDWRRSVRDFLDRNAVPIQALHGIVTIILALYVMFTGASS
jgi:dCTP deaminase